MAESVDTLVTAYLRTEDELGVLGKQIASSSRNLAIIFVDLSGSTELKHQVSPARWLGYVVRFLHTTADLAVKNAGTIVKRIGDELMLTFEDAADAERFIEATQTDESMRNFAFKTAADFGETYAMSFAADAAFDPYGSTVDRAARIAQLATRNIVLASKDYVDQLKAHAYTPIGALPLKGIPEPTNLFLRAEAAGDREKFLEHLKSILNKSDLRSRFRYLPRQFSLRDFEISPRQYRGFPFLVRELLTLPRLPYELDHFAALFKSEPERAREFLGSLAEWEAVFYSASDYPQENVVRAIVHTEKVNVFVTLFGAMADAVRTFKRGDRVVVRGVLVGASNLGLDLDYADLQPAATE
jgi:class 3 adenylate cyclase